MNAFQIAGLTLAAVMVTVILLGLLRHRQQRRMRLALVFAWLTAVVAILVPDLTMSAAAAVGIGRGADLLLYAAVLVALVVLLVIYLRFAALENQITELVRQLALARVRRSQSNESDSGSE